MNSDKQTLISEFILTVHTSQFAKQLAKRVQNCEAEEKD